MVAKMSRIFRLILATVKHLVPWVVRAIQGGLFLIALTVEGIWKGYPQTADEMALYLSECARKFGVPSLYDVLLYRVCLILAYLELAVAWILFSYCTTGVFGWVWRLIF
jgi:hypothetical protein